MKDEETVMTLKQIQERLDGIEKQLAEVSEELNSISEAIGELREILLPPEPEP